MQRMTLPLIAALSFALSGCLDLPIAAMASAGSPSSSLPKAYGYYGTGHPLDRPNQIRREVVFGQAGSGKPCWKR